MNSNNQPTSAITFAMTGASGAPYGLHLLTQLTKYYQQVHVVISKAARVVLATESAMKLPESPQKAQALLTEYCQCEESVIQVYSSENWFSPIASGSAAPKQMVICPASMGCVSAIANGASDTLLERAADVVIKEKGQLLILPREMPFSTIHLRNLLTLSESGAVIMPTCPGFYNGPESIQDLIDFVSARVLNHLGIDNQLSGSWGYSEKNKT